MTMKRKSWQDYQKEIADDHYYYARSCIRQNFFPGSEKLFIDMLRNDLGKDLSDDPKHSSCTGIGYHSDIVPLETIMTVVARQFALGFPGYAEEVLLSILPIVAVFVLFQLLTRCYRRRQLLRTGVGFLYTVIGLILFLTGVNVGFAPVGSLLGSNLAAQTWRFVLIPIGALIGYYIVKAEPAVQVLNKQVEDVTNGSISRSAMNLCLSIGVSASVALALLRILTGLNIYWLLIPGYIIALVLTRGIRGTNIFRTVYFMPNLIGGILLGYIWQILLNGVLANLQKPLLALDAKAGFVGLVILMCWQQIGYMMIIYVAGLQSVPGDLIEAAKIDGANDREILFKIKIPMVMPSVTICTFLTLTNSFKLFDQNVALTAGEPANASEMLALNIYNTFYGRSGAQWKGIGQAKAVVFFLIVVVISLIQLHFTRSKEVQA